MNETHPIEGLMKTAMDSIKEMVDVNTIIGTPITSTNNMMIVPISKVCFGFAAGGSEFNTETINEYRKKNKEEEGKFRLPFGGGSGAGVNISPVAFLVIMEENVKILPIDHTSPIDKLIDYVPDLMQKLDLKRNNQTFKSNFSSSMQNKNDEENNIEDDYSNLEDE